MYWIKYYFVYLMLSISDPVLPSFIKAYSLLTKL